MRWRDLRRTLLRTSILLAVLMALSAMSLSSRYVAASAIQTSDDARALAPGDPIEREIAEGETHSYRIALAEGQYLHVSVKGQGVALQVALRDPGGKKVFERGRNHRLRPEVVLALARQSGDHTLSVSATRRLGGRGSYSVSIEELRSAAPEDHHRVAAETALAEGEELRKQGTKQSLKKALEKFEESLAGWQVIADRKGQAETLNLKGLVHRALGQSRQAIECFNRALPLFREEGDRLGEGEALNNLATAHYALGGSEQALDLYNQALPLQRETGDRQGEVATLNNLGSIYWATGEAVLALDYYNRSLPLRRELGDREGEARTLNNLGTAYSQLGELQKALEFSLKALPLRRASGDRRGEATTLSNIGVIYYDLGEPEKSLDYNEQALPLRRASGDRTGEAYTLRNIALAHSALGDDQKALDLLQQALAILRDAGDRRGEASVLHHLGSIQGRLGNHQQSLDINNQSLAAYKAVGDRTGEARSLAEIARAYHSLGRTAESLDRYREALAIYKATKHPGGQAQALLGIARIERGLGRYAESRKSGEAALEIIESLRGRVAAEGLRASYFANNQDFYEFYIDLLMEMHGRRPSEGCSGAALEASERARSRSLLDSLAESRAGFRQGIDHALLVRESEIRQRLNAKDSYRIRLLNGKHTQQQLASVEKQITELEAEYQDLQAQIRRLNPRYAALTQPAPLSLKEIQQQVLDENTLLLEYALGERRSFLWAVTRESIASFELPGRGDIEAAARRAHELLGVSHRRQHRRASELALAELSRMLLRPAAGHLENKRLLIVADGILHYIPFAALPAPESRSDPRASYTPLIVDHEVVNLPSASVLAVLRREVADRKAAGKLLAVFADPVFDSDDQRFGKVSGGAALDSRTVASGAERAASDDLPEAARKVGLSSFERLPFSGREANAILSLAGERDSLKALGFKANLARAASPELADYRIVHFATHGLINNERPALSGLVLSLYDEQGRPQNGFLRAHDIYNLKIEAELVVLSSCRTALGKQVRGEGLVGLVRGFMYAGAPRVVASLWDVKDDATAELMRLFYARMIKDGMRPAAALRAAQVEMLSEPRWRAPYYWAAFLLQGEWK